MEGWLSGGAVDCLLCGADVETVEQFGMKREGIRTIRERHGVRGGAVCKKDQGKGWWIHVDDGRDVFGERERLIESREGNVLRSDAVT